MEVQEIVFEKEDGIWAKTGRATLEGVEFDFKVYINERFDLYRMEISQGNDPILGETVLRANVDLLRGCTHENRPKGRLYLYDKEMQTVIGRNATAGLFGDKVILVYEDSEPITPDIS